MSCPGCRSSTCTSYICSPCLCKLLRLYKTQTASHHASLYPAAVTRAKGGIAILKEHRELNAKHWTKARRVQELNVHLVELGALKDKNTAALSRRKQALDERRERLRLAREALRGAGAGSSARPRITSSLLPSSGELDEATHHLQTELETCHSEVGQARRFLLSVVMEALSVSPSRATGSKYEIGFLPVPPVHLLEKLPKKQANATVALLVFLVRLATFYLGIKLPFEIIGTPLKPLIRAASGTANTIKYGKSCPLYLSSGSSAAHQAPTSDSVLSASPSSSPSKSAGSAATPASHAQAFSTALKMLAYDAAYIHYLATLEATIRPVQPEECDILSTLVAAFEAPTLGQHSHTATAAEYTLRTTEWPDNPFPDFLGRLARAEQDARTELREDARNGKGTYVVVGPDQEHRSSGSADAGKEEDWDVL